MMNQSWRAAVSILVMSVAFQCRAADIYPAASQADADLVAALSRVAHTNRRVILDFGGNWCTDCRVLDSYFHDASVAPLMTHFELVHVNIGHLDANEALAKRYGIPLKKGVPALAVLDAQGQLLFSQKRGEFEAMRSMNQSAVAEFLIRWQGPAS